MAQLRHFDAKAKRKDMLDTLRKDGAFIVDSVTDEGAIAALRRETDPYMEKTRNGSDDFTGRLTTRTGGLVMRSEGCRELIQHDLILKLCDGFLLDYCERYQLHLTQIIRIRPGAKKQAIHRDRWAWGQHLAHIEPQLNTIWALTDFAAENGATWVVPGSTTWRDDRRAEAKEKARADMTAGSVLVYTGSVFHGGGANQTHEDRVGLNITYALGWLRQEENQYLSTPPHLARALNPELQRLIGYTMGQYALGYFTPPGAPGEAPEVVDPQYALDSSENFAESLGSPEALSAVSERILAKATRADSQSAHDEE
ncbi:MAG: phytanoyl-CoA dioxygenase family protein [Myxococcota bacterium]